MISQTVQIANASPPHTGGNAQCQPSKRHPCEPSHQTPQTPPSSSSQQNTPSHQTPPSTANAPLATSGKNVYVTWWSNNTGDWEIFIRASTDGGKTFGDKINLSNSDGLLSHNAKIATEGKNVYVSWWETNQSNNKPVMRVSNDNGKSFGPLLTLSDETAVAIASTNK